MSGAFDLLKQNNKSLNNEQHQEVADDGKQFFVESGSGYYDGLSGDLTKVNDYKTKGAQVRANVGWVFKGNDRVASACAAVELKLMQIQPDGDKEEVTSGSDYERLFRLLDVPNYQMSGTVLRKMYFSYMNLNGEAYIAKGEIFKGLPLALHTLPSHLVQYRIDTTGNEAIIFGGKSIDPDMIILDRNPDPVDPFRGMSVIAAAAQTIDTEEQSKKFNRQFFANSARPSVTVEVPKVMQPDQFRRFKQQFEEFHTGQYNAYKPLILEGGAKANAFALTQKDMDFLESRKFNKDEILAMFGVSPGMLGMTENVNRSNMEAAEYIFAKYEVKDRVKQFVDILNKSLINPWNEANGTKYELDFDNPVPEDVKMNLEHRKNAVNNWMTVDEVRELEGLPPLPNGAGKVLMPKNAIVPEATADNSSSDSTDDESKKKDELKTLKKKTAKLLKASGILNGKHKVKQIAARDYPKLYDGLDVDPDELGCIMANLQPLKVLEIVEDSEDDLVEKTKNDWSPVPAEDEPHVTLLYGLLENGNKWKDKVDTVLEGWKLKGVKITEVGTFELEDSIAVVAHIEKTPELIDGHERLTLLPHIQTFSEYLPHMTLAYIKKDADAEKWVKALGAEYNGKSIKFSGINYGDPEVATKQLFAQRIEKKKKQLEKQETGTNRIIALDEPLDEFEWQFVRVLRGQFEQQRQALMLMLKGQKALKGSKKKAIDEEAIALFVDSQYSIELSKQITPLYAEIMKQSAANASALLPTGVAPLDKTDDWTNFIDQRAGKIAKDINDETQKQIVTTLKQGLTAGENVDELRARVESVFGDASSVRAERIARTESKRAASEADLQVWKSSSIVEGKEWFTQGNNPCPYCQSLNGKMYDVTETIFEQNSSHKVTFTNDKGKEVTQVRKYSYESVVAPPLHPSCRCILLPVIKKF
jgi:HK97 family phage portal protein